jgi:phosphoenolpyruvate synthase/pyruvate phosphate dikinase
MPADVATKEKIRVSHPGDASVEEFDPAVVKNPEDAVAEYRKRHGKIITNHPYRVEFKGKEFEVLPAPTDKNKTGTPGEKDKQ